MGRVENLRAGAARDFGPAPGNPFEEGHTTDIPTGFAAIAGEATGLLEAARAWGEDFLELQKLRLGMAVRDAMVRAAVYAGAGLIALLGFVLVTAGLALWLGEMVASTAGGLLIVGAVYLIAGAVAIMLNGARNGSTRRQTHA